MALQKRIDMELVNRTLVHGASLSHRHPSIDLDQESKQNYQHKAVEK